MYSDKIPVIGKKLTKKEVDQKLRDFFDRINKLAEEPGYLEEVIKHAKEQRAARELGEHMHVEVLSFGERPHIRI